MKSKTVLVVFFFIAGFLHAGQPFDPDQKPLHLLDGRVFEKWQIISETASSVTIRYPGGGVAVPKKVLPENLQQIYKIDPDAVAAEEKEKAEGKRIYEEQVHAQEIKRQAAHEAEVANALAEKQVADMREKQRQESLQAIADKKAEIAARSAKKDSSASSVTRVETHVDSSRTISTEIAQVDLPDEPKRKAFAAEYEIVTTTASLDLKFGENGQHSDLKAEPVDHGWSKKITAKTGDRLFLSASSGRVGGEIFILRIKLEGQVVKEATASGLNALAEASYTIP